MAKCKYKSEVPPNYECPEDALPDSEDGFCIFHERRMDKDIEKFNAGIAAKMEKKDYDFTGYYFPEDIDFGWLVFERIVQFEAAEFQGRAWFVRAEFQGEGFFAGAKFEGGAWFSEAEFRGRAWFAGAKFQDEASFDGAKFLGGVLLDGAKFLGGAFFNKAKFERGASFDGAKFLRAAWFRGAEFQRDASFYGAEFGRTVSFRYADFKHPEEAEVAYRKAKITYQREGDYAEAGYYRLLEMRARRAQRNPIIRSLEFLSIDLTCGYGEQWWKVIPAALTLVFGCAVLYYFFFPITSTSPDIQITGIGWGYFKDCLYFSFVTFTTLGYGDLYPMPEVWTRAVASIEAFTGAFMMALFVLCFARKWMR